MTTTPTIGRVSSGWGKRKALIPGMTTFHRGVDISAAAGTVVVAPQAGVVTTASYNLIRGHYVIVDHGRYQTLSQHLSRRLAVKGQDVAEGQWVGLMGRTGNVTGVHNHTEVRDNGIRIDPTPWYLERGVTLGIAQAVAGVSTTPPTPPPAQEDDMAVTRSIVEGIYWTQLGRGPSDREVDERITESLEGAGYTAADLLRSVRGSKEYKAYRLRRGYQDLLGRNPDAAGAANYLAAWLAHPEWSEADVWNEIRKAPEYGDFMAKPPAVRSAAVAAARATLTRR